MVGAVNVDLWPTDAELDELATISRTSRRSTVCVPVGAAYAPDGAGGRTLAPPDSWREVCHVGTRPQKVAADRRPAGEAMRDRRQWVVVTDPTVDLLENNPSRLVMLGTLETFPTATANGADTGIAFGGIFNGLLVGGNRCHDNQTVKSQGYGIGALSGTYTGCRIGDNNLTGNRVKGLNIAAGPLAAIELGDNTGALTTKTGSAIIADGASTVLVTHSLIATPTNVQLTPASSATVWVTTPTSTDFTVNRTGTTGALTVYWTAQIGTSA